MNVSVDHSLAWTHFRVQAVHGVQGDLAAVLCSTLYPTPTITAHINTNKQQTVVVFVLVRY